jgi:hypothetical protein
VTERKPTGMSFESWVDKQIREATERGEFDDLPGAGKPLPGAGKPHEEQWWLKNYLQREGLSAEALLPAPLQLRKEIDRLPETVRGLRTEREVREVAARLNREIVEWLRAPAGPQIPVRPVSVDDVVERWRPERAAVPVVRPETGDPAPPKQKWWRIRRSR